jgi:hypothetical protein
LPAGVDFLHEFRRNQGPTQAQKPARTEDKIVRLRAIGRKERHLDLPDSTVARHDDETAAGRQCLAFGLSQLLAPLDGHRSGVCTNMHDGSLVSGRSSGTTAADQHDVN